MRENTKNTYAALIPLALPARFKTSSYISVPWVPLLTFFVHPLIRHLGSPRWLRRRWTDCIHRWYRRNLAYFLAMRPAQSKIHVIRKNVTWQCIFYVHVTNAILNVLWSIIYGTTNVTVIEIFYEHCYGKYIFMANKILYMFPTDATFVSIVQFKEKK